MKTCSTPFLSSVLAAALAAAILPARLAYAQTAASSAIKDQEIELLKSEVQRLEQRVNTLERLDQKVRVIDRKLDVQERAQEAQGESQKVQADIEQTKLLQMPVVRASDEGFEFSTPDDNYRIRFAGNVQADSRSFTSGDDKNVSSTFYLNKARPILSGAVAKYYEFQIMPDFGQGRVTLQDAWLNIAYFAQAQLRMGKYKAPVNLERLQSEYRVHPALRSSEPRPEPRYRS